MRYLRWTVLIGGVLWSPAATSAESDATPEARQRIYQEYVLRAEVTALPPPAQVQASAGVPRAVTAGAGVTSQESRPPASGTSSIRDQGQDHAVAGVIPSPAVTIVRIGHAGPLTGPIAYLGKDDENGAQLALEEANAKRLTIDGKLVKFELVSLDDEANPRLGPMIAQKLVGAKVAGVVGHLNSGLSIPASVVYNHWGIPMISGSSTNPRLTEQGFKVVFRTTGRDDMQGRAMAVFIANALKAKKVAIADDATAYGASIANEAEMTLGAAGVQVVTREKSSDRATDFHPMLTKIRDMNPDVVFYGGMDATAGPMIKQARELGVKATFAFVDGACTIEMTKLAGPAGEGLVCSQTEIPPQMVSSDFLEAFKAKYGEVKQYAPYFYDAANILIAAMQKADSTDPAKYLLALRASSFDGATGHIEFDAKGDRKDAEMTIYQMTKGVLKPVAIVKSRKPS